jgi:hypothetical protein
MSTNEPLTLHSDVIISVPVPLWAIIAIGIIVAISTTGLLIFLFRKRNENSN